MPFRNGSGDSRLLSVKRLPAGESETLGELPKAGHPLRDGLRDGSGVGVQQQRQLD